MCYPKGLAGVQETQRISPKNLNYLKLPFAVESPSCPSFRNHLVHVFRLMADLAFEAMELAENDRICHWTITESIC